jgi:hypothetical protein
MITEQTPETNYEPTPLSEVYEMLGAKDAEDMYLKFLEEDQKQMQAGEWDYDDPESHINQVKEKVDAVDVESLNEDELYFRSQLLWLWNHHAAGVAVERQDEDAAIAFIDAALEYQPDDHPNQITQLLYYLIHGDLEEAESWAETITDATEQATAEEQIELFRQGQYFRHD